MPNSFTVAELSASPSFPMVKPKLMMATAVRIQAINVRSAGIAVPNTAKSVLGKPFGSSRTGISRPHA